MNRLLVVILFTSFSVYAAPKNQLPHMDLEMTGPEYTRMLENVQWDALSADAVELKVILEKGKRNLQWLSHMNSFRPPEKKISLSSAATQMAYPITAPGLSNPTIISDLYVAFQTEAPAWFSDVVFNGAAFTENPPTTEEEFITWGLRFDRIYQKASRWILQEPYLFQYTLRKADDVRGYYYLSREADLENTLKDFDTLSAERKAQLTSWMTGLCYNTAPNESTCQSEFSKLVTAKKPLYPYYKRYVEGGKELWDSYFKITSKREDVEWSAQTEDTMVVPFRTPDTEEVASFLTENIHDEWKFNAWTLKLDFRPSAATYIQFVPGATPHVNGLAGDEITMDANQPLTEYNVKWTIRHEYGHVIGLPDCYVEFYDKAVSTMVNYQLDTTNLMCSRQGHIKQIHYDELKKAYYK